MVFGYGFKHMNLAAVASKNFRGPGALESAQVEDYIVGTEIVFVAQRVFGIVLAPATDVRLEIMVQ